MSIRVGINGFGRIGRAVFRIMSKRDDMQVVALLPNGTTKVLVQVDGHKGSEVTGVAFDPSGTRLFFSSQRGVGGNGGGITFEVSGPFHSPA